MTAKSKSHSTKIDDTNNDKDVEKERERRTVVVARTNAEFTIADYKDHHPHRQNESINNPKQPQPRDKTNRTTTITTMLSSASSLSSSSSSSLVRKGLYFLTVMAVLILMMKSVEMSLQVHYLGNVMVATAAANHDHVIGTALDVKVLLDSPPRELPPFDRPEIVDILQHPHKTSPSSRDSSTTTMLLLSSSSSFDSNNIPWMPFRTAPGIPNVARNVRLVQDFLQSDHDHHEPAFTSTGQSSTTTPNKNNNNNNDSTNKQEKQETPLNIVLFYADDWALSVLGAINPLVHTPNIDAMARRGMLFTRNCVTTSICWISRNTLATGVYSSVHGNNELGSQQMFQHPKFAWTDTLYAQLKQYGNYFTGVVGQWHAATPPEHMQVSFDVLKLYYGRHWMMRNGQLRHVTDLNGEDALAFLRLWNTQHRRNQKWRRPKTATPPQQDQPPPPPPLNVDESSSRRAATAAAGDDEEITTMEERPFFLKVAFFATHARDNHDPPYHPMNESMFLYQNVTIPRPKTATEQHYQELPDFLKDKRNEARKRNLRRFDTEENYQVQIKNLYRMASEVDAVVGAVIDELKAMNAYDNTLLIFTTDNGNLHGEHGLTEKWYPYEESIRVPLVIQDPRMPHLRHGTHNHEDLTLNVDLAPTILKAAQLPIPPHMQGRDIAELYRHKNEVTHQKVKASWRQDFFYEWNTGEPVNATGHMFKHRVLPAVFALIRKDYKYFYWPEENYEQLFHVEKDPMEESDIFQHTSETTKQALHVMKARYRFLKAWAQAGNPV
ncbi:hypothetical protein ACA910_019189 [Epithemia clementina (nom. ined.)]